MLLTNFGDSAPQLMIRPPSFTCECIYKLKTQLSPQLEIFGYIFEQHH